MEKRALRKNHFSMRRQSATTTPIAFLAIQDYTVAWQIVFNVELAFTWNAKMAQQTKKSCHLGCLADTGTGWIENIMDHVIHYAFCHPSGVPQCQWMIYDFPMDVARHTNCMWYTTLLKWPICKQVLELSCFVKHIADAADKEIQKLSSLVPHRRTLWFWHSFLMEFWWDSFVRFWSTIIPQNSLRLWIRALETLEGTESCCFGGGGQGSIGFWKGMDETIAER